MYEYLHIYDDGYTLVTGFDVLEKIFTSPAFFFIISTQHLHPMGGVRRHHLWGQFHARGSKGHDPPSKDRGPPPEKVL